jgi:hypothetical protein
MKVPKGTALFLCEWFELKLPTLVEKSREQDLTKSQKAEVRPMMSLKKFSAVVNGVTARWEWEQLEKIAEVIFGDKKFVRLLFFDPDNPQDAAVIELILGKKIK